MKAWIENNIIRDIAHGNPIDLYHPDIARHYDTEVPANAENGDSWVNGQLVKKIVAPSPVVPAAPVTTQKIVSAIEFKLRFNSPERVSIYNSTDLIVKDFVSLIDDPRLISVDLKLKSTTDAIDYLISVGIVNAGRRNEILG